MAGAVSTTQPAAFLKPLDRLDRGLLQAESALSLVTVGLMLFSAVSESLFRVITNWSMPARGALCTLLWAVLGGLKLAGAPEDPRSPAQDLVKGLWKQDLERPAALQRVLLAYLPASLVAGFATERLMRAVLPYASDVLLHGTIWAAFLGASFATRGRRHLAIDAVSRLLPDRGRRAVVALSSTLGAFVALCLADGIRQNLHHAAEAAAESLRDLQSSGATSGTVDHSYEYQYVIPAGFLLIGARLLLHAFHEYAAALAGPGRHEAPAEPPPIEATTSAGHPPFASATGPECVIALGALGAVGLLARSASTVAPQGGMPPQPAMLMLLGFAALALLVPMGLRWRKKGSLAPDHPEHHGEVRGTPTHFAISAALVVLVLALLRYGLAPRIGSVSVPAGVLFFAVMALLGAPLFSFLGGMGLFLMVKNFLNDPLEIRRLNAFSNSLEDVLGNHFARMSVLATIPLFTLAGYIMSESRMPQRLVRVSRALLGWMPGGLAVVCVFASAFFTIFSGASGITIVAVGGLLVPALLKDRYPEGFSLGLVTTGGALGITVPPCLPLIVYGIVAGLQEPAPGQERLELQKFMLVGLLPGLVAIGLMVLYCIVIGSLSKVPRSGFDAREAGAALWEAKWELVLPVFLLAGLKTGVFNPSQAAAFTAFYVLVMEVFVYRDLSLRKDLPRIVPESMVLVGAIFVKLCAATVLVGYFVQAQVADKLFEWLTCGPPAQAFLQAHPNMGSCREAVDALARTGQGAGGVIDSKISFLLALNVFLLVIGMLMDIFSAIVVIVPLIAGIALHFDINPYHLGVVFLLNLEIGYLMPPMGLNLFIAGFRFRRPVPDLYRMVLPFIGLFVAALMIVTYVPSITLFALPNHGRPEASHGPSTTPDGPPGTTPGAGDGGGAPAPTVDRDCDVPREDEDPTAFERRCRIDFDGDGLIAGEAAGDGGAGDGGAAAGADDAGATPPTAPADASHD
ncbi:MAG: TRAP transporter large permease subunit [Deltaproteobacteria bacterium]|nr:TRAP transporter large permease subunit [Deltaproteobacteria bacterium]